MPPKKSAAKKAEPKSAAETTKQSTPPKEEDEADIPDEEGNEEGPADTSSNDKPSKKRKTNADTNEPHKSARRSAPKTSPSHHQLLNYLLSPSAADLCRPSDETAAIHQNTNLRTYSSSLLNPFEELLCALILSRPISHRLGLRSIRTILNEPYTFTSARAVQNAGPEKHHQALEDARTQHKSKTAEQIGRLADVVLEKFTATDDKEGTQVQKVRDDCGRDVPTEREYLAKNINGLGKTGLDIFFRRVQWVWTAGYPFVDEKTGEALQKLGLPADGAELETAMEECWEKLDTSHVAGDDEEVKKKRVFVTILERATGAELEGKGEELVKAAAAAA